MRVVLSFQWYGRKLIPRSIRTCIHGHGWGRVAYATKYYSDTSDLECEELSISVFPVVLSFPSYWMLLMCMTCTRNLQLIGHPSPLPAARHGGIGTCCSMDWHQGREESLLTGPQVEEKQHSEQNSLRKWL